MAMRIAWRLSLVFLVFASSASAAARAQAPLVEGDALQSSGTNDIPSSPAVRCNEGDSTAGQPANCDAGHRETMLPNVQSNRSAAAPIPPADQATANRDNFVVAICLAVGREAMANDLPAEFFTRLIWQESRFNPDARSHVGAEGIAQFMPGTARWRGLANTYDPFQALRESARWLAELRKQFGNLGLAAAAYNAGPGRIQSWLSGRASLPAETRYYVRVITGHSADEWSQQKAKDDDNRVLKIIPCNEIAKLIARRSQPSRVAAQSKVSAEASVAGPWGLQLTGNWSEFQALNEYRKLQERFPAILGNKQPLVLRSQMAGKGSAVWYRVRVAESTRDRAKELCKKLETAGGKCLVLRN